MALKATITADEHKALNDDLKSHYNEVDGTFTLQVTPSNGLALENVDGLKTSLGKERENASSLEKKLKAFKDIDPKKAKEALSKWEEIEGWDPDKKVSEAVKAREAQMIEKHAEELKTRDASESSLKTALSRTLIEAAATTALSEAGGSVVLLLPHVTSHARLKGSDNGSYEAEVIDALGNPRIGDAKGNPMTIKQLVDEMKGSDIYAQAFRGTGSSGSGSSGAGGKGGGSGSGDGDGRVINPTDQDSINASIEDIASGKATIGEYTPGT